MNVSVNSTGAKSSAPLINDCHSPALTEVLITPSSLNLLYTLVKPSLSIPPNWFWRILKVVFPFLNGKIPLLRLKLTPPKPFLSCVVWSQTVFICWDTPLILRHPCINLLFLNPAFSAKVLSKFCNVAAISGLVHCPSRSLPVFSIFTSFLLGAPSSCLKMYCAFV